MKKLHFLVGYKPSETKVLWFDRFAETVTELLNWFSMNELRRNSENAKKLGREFVDSGRRNHVIERV